MDLSKISTWYAHLNKSTICIKKKPLDCQQQAPSEADLIVILSLPFCYVFPFSFVLPSRSASSCCHSSFSYSLVSSSFLPCFSLSPILLPSFFPCFLLPSLNSSFLSLLPCVFPSFICVSSSTSNVT